MQNEMSPTVPDRITLTNKIGLGIVPRGSRFVIFIYGGKRCLYSVIIFQVSEQEKIKDWVYQHFSTNIFFWIFGW